MKLLNCDVCKNERVVDGRPCEDCRCELSADDLRHTMPGMPCRWNNETPAFFLSVFKNEVFVKLSGIGWSEICSDTSAIQVLISDWRRYTARRLFEINPEAKWITRFSWWYQKPSFFANQWRCISRQAYVCGDHNLPDLWPGAPDEYAIISRQEVENGEKNKNS